jgi:hypothetical protein
MKGGPSVANSVCPPMSSTASPSPAPDLAVRIIGEITAERLEVLRQADLRVREEIMKMPNHLDVWQYFAVLLPIQSVGVMGDSRTYENVIAVRAVQSLDGMTADWFKLPYEGVMDSISNRIINEGQDGGQPCRLRHQLQAPRHHRMGIMYFTGNRNGQVSGHILNNPANQIRMLQQERSIAPAPGNILRTPQIQVHGLAIRLHIPGRRQHNLRIVPAKLHDQRTVFRHRREFRAPVLRTLRKQTRMQHGRIA